MIVDLLILFGLHFLADFILQSREMGKKKSEEFDYLIAHGVIIFTVFFVVSVFIFDDIHKSLSFVFLYTILHCFQDWFIWRGYKAYTKWSWREHNESNYHMDEYIKDGFKYWEDKTFYTTIGLDQARHFATIILIYNWVI